MFRIILKSLQTGVLTEANPFGGHASFGFPVIDFSRCTACDECARSCPTGAIQTATPSPGRKTVSLSYAACIQCRACVTACPEQAVSVSTDVEIAAYSRQQLARTASFDIDPMTGRGTFGQMEVEAGLSLSESAARLRERIRGRLGRSLHVRQVDAGSCNGCELEIAATTNPLYDLGTIRDPPGRESPARGRPARHRARDAQHGDRASQDLRSGTGAARRGRRGRLRVQWRDLRRGHLRRCRRRRSRPAGGRLHSRLPAASSGDSQRAAGGDGRS